MVAMKKAEEKEIKAIAFMFDRSNSSERESRRRKRVSLDEERLKKNRKIVDHYLKRIRVGKNLSLNQEGIAYFPCKKFLIVIEVAEDSPNVCYLYTMVCRLDPSDPRDPRDKVLQRAMELNYMQQGTRGATLGLEGEEINLCFSTPISALTLNDLKSILEDFILTASEMNEQLDAAKGPMP